MLDSENVTINKRWFVRRGLKFCFLREKAVRRSPRNYEKKRTKVKELTKMLKMMLLVPISFFKSHIMALGFSFWRVWRVLSFDLTTVIFAACFTLRDHDTNIDFLWVLFLVGRIGPLIQTLCSLLRLNKGFRLFNFLQSVSWIWIIKSDFLLSANEMVSCNVLTRRAHNLECPMNLTGFVCVLCHWRNNWSFRYNVLSVEYFFD